MKIGDDLPLWQGIVAKVIGVVGHDLCLIEDPAGELKLAYEFAPYQYKFWDVPDMMRDLV
tara:strand:- start:767 stop:946 length:180 start_codon:yes stop_codon:yes gene_type:complete